MPLTYEEALDTLVNMFGEPWTKQDLDAVLRHHNGHMENTVNTLLAHGDADPRALIEQLKVEDAVTSQDAALARQLAQAEQGRRGGRASGAPTTSARQVVAAPPPPPPKGRGTFTTLPRDFLRIPGASTRSTTTTTAASTMDEDEALARMLQDELFSQELANNPEFAHLARGANRPRMIGGRPVRGGNSARGGGGSRVSEMPRRTASGRGGAEEGPKIMEKISELGENARKRLQIMAAQFNQNRGAGGSSGGGLATNTQAMAAQEQRGLLDGDGDDDGEEMELTFSRTATSKKDT